MTYDFFMISNNHHSRNPPKKKHPSHVCRLVPEAPPRNITAEATSPTTISLTWEPAVERSSGRIIYYKVFLVESGRPESEATVTTLNNATAIVLDELKRWTEYKIWVLAGTSVGDGPKSYPMTVRTHEDGMYFILIFFVDLSTSFFYLIKFVIDIVNY